MFLCQFNGYFDCELEVIDSKSGPNHGTTTLFKGDGMDCNALETTKPTMLADNVFCLFLAS